MERSRRIRSAVILEAALLFLMGVILWENGKLPQKSAVETTADGYIKWVDFNVSYEALSRAYEYDIGSYGEKQHLDWIDLLAYVGAKNGGDFGAGATEDMRTAAEKILCGEDTMERMTADLKMFSYYRDAYGAVLGGMVGEYEIQEKEDGAYVKKYGLKAFSPIAKGFEYSDYDDFGVSRSYGYQRQHLRQNYPYREQLKEGDVVTAGDVIGYMGHTGYSTKENVNNINTVHLHFGLQLIFDESQKEGNNEIWVDCYNLTRFLYKNRSAVQKVGESREWKRTLQMTDPAVVKYQKTVKKQ